VLTNSDLALNERARKLTKSENIVGDVGIMNYEIWGVQGAKRRIPNNRIQFIAYNDVFS
jgi:hypothetical protein